jgi:MoaA/NifB/PqqE/SkfB family radical SAM enzyme
MKNSTIKDIVLAITYRCNSRCRMCNIWQKTEQAPEFFLDDLKNLPVNLESLNLSGGEPFLRVDLIEMVKIVRKHCPKTSITISSNGFATKLILERMAEIIKIDPRISVAISIDGLDDEHDEIRGIPGGFNKAVATIKELKALGIKKLRLAFTIADYNYEELKKVYNLARELGIEMTLAAVHSSENYFSQENKIKDQEKIAAELDWLIKKEISSWNPKRWLRAYFTFGLKQFVLTGQRILPDYSGVLNCFIDPQGDIYPCDVSVKKIGNLHEGFWPRQDLPLGVPDAIASAKSAGTPSGDPAGAKKECGRSWMICTVRQAMKKHWLKVLGWIVANKL